MKTLTNQQLLQVAAGTAEKGQGDGENQRLADVHNEKLTPPEQQACAPVNIKISVNIIIPPNRKCFITVVTVTTLKKNHF